MPGDDRAAWIAAMMARLESRREALSALPSSPETVDWVETERTFREHYTSLTAPKRRAFLLSADTTAYLAQDDGSDVMPMPDLRWPGGDGQQPQVAGHFAPGDVAELRELAAQCS